MEKVSKQIQEKVKRKPDGAVFTLEDVLPKSSTQREYLRAVKTLSKLQQEKRVSRIRKGLYFKPKKLNSAEIVITQVPKRLLVDYFQKKFKNKTYLTGAQLFNRMGLTEQVAVSSVLAVENPPKDFKEERLFFVKAKCPITEKNKKFLQILDCVEQIETVSAKHPGEVADSLMELCISRLSDAECSELVRYSKHYNTKTRAILAALFATAKKEKLAQELRDTYSVGSRVKIYFEDSAVLSNKENYGIYNING